MGFEPDDPADDQEIVAACAEAAVRIVIAANANTSAPAGFTLEVNDRFIRLGPTGAAGLPVEVGTRAFAARNPFKKALDAHRIG